METSDAEMDMLLNEIPRATSAPPHFQSFSGAALQGSAACLPDALFESKLPSSSSDSQRAQNPSPTNANPSLSPSPSQNHSPNIAPRIPQVSPKQQSLDALRENRNILEDHSSQLVENAFSTLSLQERDVETFQMLFDNRSTSTYIPGSSLRDYSKRSLYSPPALAKGRAASSPINSASVPFMSQSPFALPTHPSTLHPLSEVSLLDPSIQHSQLSFSNPVMTSAVNASYPLLRGAKDTPTLNSRDLMMQQASLEQRPGQLVRQQALDWNALVPKGSDFLPHSCSAGDFFDLPAVSVSVPNGYRAMHSVDLYGNALSTASQEGGELLALVQQRKLQLERQAMEDKLYTRQLQTGLNEGINDHLKYMGRSMKYSLHTSSLGDMQHTPASITAYDNALTGHDINSRFYPQGHCIRGSTCPFLHPPNFEGSSPVLSSHKAALGGPELYERMGALSSNQAFQRRCAHSNGNYDDLSALSDGRRRRDKAGNGVVNSDSYFLPEERISLKTFLDDGTETLHQFFRFTSLDDLEGRIFGVAKDQHGCRFLQRKLDEAKPDDVDKIFQEIKQHIVQLMTDPFGNYLVQKLLDACNERHRTAILEAVTKNDDLISISLNIHGTRAVQKLIETLQNPDQISMLISCLKQGVVTLIKDLNGNHVVQRCLQRLKNEDNQFIFDAAASHCVEIASHRHGCCVLQRCVDFATGMQQQQLVAEIAVHALALSQDQYGNYVVQYILELGLRWASAEVISKLEGSFAHLAMQKFSSNVVEKCLKVATEENKVIIAKELVSSSGLGQLLQDPYANYVIQSALQVAKGHLHASIVDAIKPHVHVLRSSPYGKRILSRMQFKK